MLKCDRLIGNTFCIKKRADMGKIKKTCTQYSSLLFFTGVGYSFTYLNNFASNDILI